MCYVCVSVEVGGAPNTTHRPPPTTSCSTLTPAEKRPTANATKTKNPKRPRAKTTSLTFRTKMVGVEGGVCRCDPGKSVCASGIVRHTSEPFHLSCVCVYFGKRTLHWSAGHSQFDSSECQTVKRSEIRF